VIKQGHCLDAQESKINFEKNKSKCVAQVERASLVARLRVRLVKMGSWGQTNSKHCHGLPEYIMIPWAHSLTLGYAEY